MFRRRIPTALAVAMAMASAQSGLAQQAASQGNDNGKPSSRLERFERSLAPPTLIEGRTRPNWSLKERMAFHNVPGLSIAVIENGKIAWSKAYGLADSRSQSPVAARTRFQAASISKAVTALAALRLVEMGKLSLDGPVNDYLTSWKIPENEFTRQQPVTLRHLLSHTGGVTGYGFPGYAAGVQLPSIMQILEGTSPANTAPIVVDKRPGEGFRYSGGGYMIIQLLLEDVSGEAFAPLLSRLVLEPGGMTRSTYTQPSSHPRAPDAARAHEGLNSIPTTGHSHIYPEMAVGGLWTTPQDLMNLALVLSGSGDGQSPISKNMMAEVATPQAGASFGEGNPYSFSAFGLGFQLAETRDGLILGHDGANPGFRAFWFFYPDGRGGAAIMMNADNGGSLMPEIQSALAETYGWELGASRVRAALPTTAEERQELVGNYRLVIGGDGLAATISEVDHVLMYEALPFDKRTEFHKTSDDVFFVATGQRDFRILRNEQGKVTGLSSGTLQFKKENS